MLLLICCSLGRVFVEIVWVYLFFVGFITDFVWWTRSTSSGMIFTDYYYFCCCCLVIAKYCLYSFHVSCYELGAKVGIVKWMYFVLEWLNMLNESQFITHFRWNNFVFRFLLFGIAACFAYNKFTSRDLITKLQSHYLKSIENLTVHLVFKLFVHHFDFCEYQHFYVRNKYLRVFFS